MDFEFKILDALQRIHNGFLDKIMVWLTDMGEGAKIWIAIAFVLLLFKKTRKCGILMLICMYIEKVIGEDTLKPFVGRIRPFLIKFKHTSLIPMPSNDFSFPSGHAFVSFTAAFTIFLHNKKAGIAALILAAFISFSRLYFYVHYPSDVLAGAVFGIVVSLIVYFLAYLIIKLVKMRINKGKS